MQNHEPNLMQEREPNFFRRLFRMRGVGQVITVTGGLIVLIIVFQILNPNFLGERNIANLLRQIAPYVIVGIGQSYVLITGNIDLSIGSVYGMSCMMSATLMTKGVNPWLAALISIASCLVIGVINGVLVANFKLPPFIATLGTMTVARGIAQLVNNGYNTGSITEIAGGATSAEAAARHKELALGFSDAFYYGRLFNFLYYTVLIAAVLWIVFNFILTRTETGRHIYAVGSNIEAAKMSGVSVPKTVITAYVVSSFCAGTVGLIQCAQARSGAMNAGQSYEMYAVAASVIGGVSTLGGQGLLAGTIVGASIWAVLENGLSLAKVPVAFQNVIIGIIVIASVLSDVIIRQRKD